MLLLLIGKLRKYVVLGFPYTHSQADYSKGGVDIKYLVRPPVYLLSM